MVQDLREIIEKYALANAFQHNGKANPKAVLGKVLSADPDLRNNIDIVAKEVLEVIIRINKLSLSQQESELKEVYPELFTIEKKEKSMVELLGAMQGKVITRMPPEPSKHMLVGHALSFLINYIYANKYKGKCVLRYDDTNPEKIKQEYVDSFEWGIKKFLGIKPNKIVFESDDILKMYKEIEKLIRKKQAYACSCSADKISKLRRNRQPCEHRKQNAKLNLKIWNKMIKGEFKANEQIIRLTGKMKSNNAVMRDPVIARINYTEHYRQKNKLGVWPTYDFASSCEEEWCEVTHVLRSIDFGEERVELQKFIANLLDFREKIYIQYGRFNIAGIEKSSGRVIRELIKKGNKWDDIRLPTIAALERRGFVKETFYELAKLVGLSKTPTNIDEKLLATINRRFIDLSADRLFFVAKPVKIKIKDMPDMSSIKAKIHPDKKALKTVPVSDEIYVSHADFNKFKGKDIRLKDLFNIKLGKISKYKKGAGRELHKIQWVSANKNLKAEVLMPTGETIKGLIEINAQKLKKSAVIQLEQFAFAKLDGKSKSKQVFCFAHR